MTNDRLYIHEFIDIRGHHRADYMHHMTANWSPNAQEDRGQLCYGVWGVVGSTGAWPQVLNIWEEPGWDGMADSFAAELVGADLQDPKLKKWWARASEFRRGGYDRLVEPAPWMRTSTEALADGVRGDCFLHELVTVRPGSARDLLELARERATAAYSTYGWELTGAWTTAMRDEDEAILLWAVPTWHAWAAGEKAQTADDAVIGWRSAARELTTDWQRIALVDAPLCPFRTGRQPTREDRTDWVE